MNLLDSKLYNEDIDIAIKHSVNIEKMKKSKVLITGVTGTIGSFIADMFVKLNKDYAYSCCLYLAGRSVEKLKDKYEPFNDGCITYVIYDINKSIEFDFEVDYIVHAAGNAHPAAFTSDPVGTIIGNVNGTYNLLEYARMHNTKRFLYISSGEVYGQGDETLKSFDEKYISPIDIVSPRSCYPSSKRTTENLCASYFAQYGLETVIARPSHTFGPCITPSDSRANAQFIRNALDKKNIVLKSKGTQIRSYNYIADCASGLITILLNGDCGQAYNTSNPAIQISIAELAETIANEAGTDIIFEIANEEDLKNQSPIPNQVLSCEKLRALGWNEAFRIEDAVKHTILILQGE